MKRIFNFILLVCFIMWCVILFIRTLEKPIKQVLLNERNELLYRNDSDTLKQFEYFKIK